MTKKDFICYWNDQLLREKVFEQSIALYHLEKLQKKIEKRIKKESKKRLNTLFQLDENDISKIKFRVIRKTLRFIYGLETSQQRKQLQMIQIADRMKENTDYSKFNSYKSLALGLEYYADYLHNNPELFIKNI